MPDVISLDKENSKFHPGRMKRFISHLSTASLKAEDRSVKKAAIRDHLDTIRSVSLNKRSTKKQIESALGDFEYSIRELIHDEEKILEEQRKETKQISELRALVEKLSGKLIDVGREYAEELEEKDAKILELREALAAANMRASEAEGNRKKRMAAIEKKLASDGSVEKKDHIALLEKHISSLEERHADLKKSGKHSRSDLERVRKQIESHKNKIEILKAKN